MYRYKEYNEFIDWAKTQSTDEIWKRCQDGCYFKMLKCHLCDVPVHEELLGKSHSGMSEDIGWAIRDNHKYLPHHFYLGDLGTSTNSLGMLAEAILTDQ